MSVWSEGDGEDGEGEGAFCRKIVMVYHRMLN